MVNLLIRKSYLLRGKKQKEVFTMETSIEEFRKNCEKGAARYSSMPRGIEIQEEVIAHCKSEWIIPEGANEKSLVFYVHGGGYVSGSLTDHRSFVAKFAKNTGITNLLYEYRLAPENPYPAALNDSVKVYEAVLEMGYKPENIVVAGESAGGGLLLAMLLALKERGIPMPKAAVSISPWTDLTCASDSYKTKNRFSPAPTDSWHVFAKHYAGDEQLSNPLISPLFGDLAGLPSLYIVSGENDELFEDGEKFAAKAKEAGVNVKSFRLYIAQSVGKQDYKN